LQFSFRKASLRPSGRRALDGRSHVFFDLAKLPAASLEPRQVVAAQFGDAAPVEPHDKLLVGFIEIEAALVTTVDQVRLLIPR
jgi:hypothetical protein